MEVSIGPVGADRCVGPNTLLRGTRPRADTQVRPYAGEWKVPATTQPSGAQRSVCAADGRNEEESRQRSSPKCPSTSDNPSVSLAADSSLYTREPLRTGDADCRVASLLAMTVLILCHSEEAQRADVGIRPFSDGRGFGPPRSSAPTERNGSPPLPPEQRLAKRKARKEELVKFGFCPIPSECSTAYRVRRSAESPARAPADVTLTEQNGLAPHPVVQEDAKRPGCTTTKAIFSSTVNGAFFFQEKKNGGFKAAGLPRHPRPAGRSGRRGRRPLRVQREKCSAAARRT